jgi:hypothetical protein
VIQVNTLALYEATSFNDAVRGIFFCPDYNLSAGKARSFSGQYIYFRFANPEGVITFGRIIGGDHAFINFNAANGRPRYYRDASIT